MLRGLFSIAVTTIISGILLILFVYIGIIIYLGQASKNPHHADGIIVLGSTHSDMATARALTGLAAYEKKYAPVIILTGGKTSSQKSEADFMAEIINEKTETNPKIIIEDKSLSTVENFKNAREFFDSSNTKPPRIVIITDSFHLLRSILIAHKYGYEDVQWIATEPSYMSFWRRGGYYLSELKTIILNFSSLI